MPYKNQFWTLGLTNYDEVSKIPLSVRLRAILVNKMLWKQPDENLYNSYTLGRAVPGREQGTFANLIGWNALNIFSWPGTILAVMKTVILAGLDLAPLTMKNGLINTNFETDGNYLRIGAKYVVQALFFLPELFTFIVAKGSDIVLNSAEDFAKEVKKLASKETIIAKEESEEKLAPLEVKNHLREDLDNDNAIEMEELPKAKPVKPNTEPNPPDFRRKSQNPDYNSVSDIVDLYAQGDPELQKKMKNELHPKSNEGDEELSHSNQNPK